MIHRIGMILFTIILGASMAANTVQAQTTWYVDDNAPGDPGPGNPGVSDPNEDGSAAHPFDAIQEAIDAAMAGDTVLVLDGIYSGTGNMDLDPGGRAITVRSANGPDSCQINPSHNGRGFYLHQGETRQTALEGFTIKNGARQNGGGLGIAGCSPTIRNCDILYCRAEQDGGGFYVAGLAAPLITDCTIASNYADDFGGGILCAGLATPQIIRCTIQANQGFNGGGGISCLDNSAPAIIDCQVIGNYCEDFSEGGGIAAVGDSAPLITGCTVTGNSVGLWNTSRGGGIYWSGGACPTLLGCTITDNNANGFDGRGGGISGWNNTGATPIIKDCVISGNYALGDGGGIYCADATAITNCLVSGNSSDFYTGGISIFRGSPTVTNCSIAGNSASEPGGGVYGFESEVTMNNCILWGNSPDSYLFHSSTPVITHSDVQGGFAGDGNINSNPLFVTGPNGNNYLSQLAAGQLADSPCLDAGDPASPLVDGTTRTDEIKDSGIADMGYHYPVQATVDSFLSCSPSTGSLPFSSRMTVALFNHVPDAARRIAARIDIELADGRSIPGWRTGFSNVEPGAIYYATWPQAIPALDSLIGRNLFQLAVEDVTPAPYNQPPYRPAGDTAFDSCLIEGISP